MYKIGIYGGTFDPIHNGHINCAKGAFKYLELDKIIFVPNNIPPHKKKITMSSNYDRYNMCSIALKPFNSFEVSNIELKRLGPSYTIDTLREIKNLYTLSSIYLIVGADMFLTINNWKQSDEIFKYAIICAVPRDKNSIIHINNHCMKLKLIGIETMILDLDIMDISSTMIRNNIMRGKSISNLVPKEVEDYIYNNNVYN